MKKFIRGVQKRVANLSVTASAVRGQPKGTAQKARDFLSQMDLREFSKMTSENGFQKLLDKHTTQLCKKLPSKSWGIARKVLNIFLFQASQDIHLNRCYSLRTTIPHLELPLDNRNAQRLQRLKAEEKSESRQLSWENISSLKPASSKKFQEFAKRYASKTYNCDRCYLDVYWWRNRKFLLIPI